MFERYTERARRVIFFARYEASKAGSPTIEAEHLLLGLLREDGNLTHRFRRDASAVESIRNDIEQRSKRGPKVPTSVDLPLSEECKRILAYAAEEANQLAQRFIGTEHLLLGILREEKCGAAEVLVGRGLRLDAVREELGKSAHDVSQGLHLDFLPGSGVTREEIMVPDAATAKQIAEAIWLPVFGVETVGGQKPVDASLVRFRVWKVSAGTLFAFIRMRDGRILAMGQSERANV
jgi:ATP-dependent Clp protease ATP-binding subunit ClpA